MGALYMEVFSFLANGKQRNFHVKLDGGALHGNFYSHLFTQIWFLCKKDTLTHKVLHFTDCTSFYFSTIPLFLTSFVTNTSAKSISPHLLTNAAHQQFLSDKPQTFVKTPSSSFPSINNIEKEL